MPVPCIAAKEQEAQPVPHNRNRRSRKRSEAKPSGAKIPGPRNDGRGVPDWRDASEVKPSEHRSHRVAGRAKRCPALPEPCCRSRRLFPLLQPKEARREAERENPRPKAWSTVAPSNMSVYRYTGRNYWTKLVVCAILILTDRVAALSVRKGALAVRRGIPSSRLRRWFRYPAAGRLRPSRFRNRRPDHRRFEPPSTRFWSP